MFSRATAVTRGWNGYRHKSRRSGKLTQEKKILSVLLPGLQPRAISITGTTLCHSVPIHSASSKSQQAM